MFDLEKAIATWRHQYKFSRLFQSIEVDELERHLRDQIQFMVDQGMSEEEAYRKTHHEFGNFSDTEVEFRKMFWMKLRYRRGVMSELTWNLTMLKNYLKVSIRTLFKNKAYTAINLSGLTVGITCCVLIYMVVQHETSFDRFHENVDQIHRVNVRWQNSNFDFTNALTPAPVGPALQAEFPEVRDMVRFMPVSEKVLVTFEEKRFYTDHQRFIYADPSVFNIFSFGLKGGNPETALAEPGTIVLTRSVAAKYFGTGDPVGQTLRIDDREDYTVTGVVDDLPSNAHFHFDFLASWENLALREADNMTSWGWNPFFTYVLLPETFSKVELQQQITDMVARYAGDEFEYGRLELQPLAEIHLEQKGNEIEQGSSSMFVYLLSVVALLILAIACFNFINLATARSSTRTREISMRKVVGARRTQLITQFIGESVFLALVSGVLAVGVVYAFLPTFSSMIDIPLSLDWSWLQAGVIVALVGLIGVLAGSYPAFVLSGYSPIGLVKGMLGGGETGRSPKRLRSSLVVFQFAVSVVLIVTTLVVVNQLNYMHNKDLGLNPEQIVSIPVQAESVLDNADVMRDELLRLPNVTKVTFASRKPGAGAWGTGVRRVDATDDDWVGLKYQSVDYDYFGTLDMAILAGRSFSRDFPSDENETGILNEEAVSQLGWSSPEEATGEYVTRGRNTRYQIVGVVRNFYFQTFRVFMQPMIMFLAPSGSDYMFVKVAGEDPGKAIAGIAGVWDKVAPEWPMTYTFLDQDYQNFYAAEERFGRVSGSFTLLALFIAGLGLFGLVSFSVERRTREMGIRKALGASGSSVVMLLSKDLARLVLIANLIAWPVAYYAADSWLQNYPFRSEIAPWIFVSATLGAMLIAWLSISYRALQASRANPVEALRYE